MIPKKLHIGSYEQNDFQYLIEIIDQDNVRLDLSTINNFIFRIVKKDRTEIFTHSIVNGKINITNNIMSGQIPFEDLSNHGDKILWYEALIIFANGDQEAILKGRFTIGRVSNDQVETNSEIQINL